MEKVVISLGGSIINSEDNDGAFLQGLASILADLSQDRELFIVCGGGKVARYYISTGRHLGSSEEDLDRMGIDVTRLNARLLQLALKENAVENMPRSVEEAANISPGKIVVMGGTTPGHTTDGVSAQLAEIIKADRIVNATSVDGVYDRDPRKFKDAKKYDKISFKRLDELMNKKHGAGNSGIFDPMGAEIVMRCRIPIIVVSGRDLLEMGKAIRGERVNGTIIGD